MIREIYVHYDYTQFDPSEMRHENLQDSLIENRVRFSLQDQIQNYPYGHFR